MKNKLSISMVMALVAILSGCAGAPKPSPLSIDQCRFPGTQTEAPGWVCDEPVPGWTVTAPGSAELTNAGLSFQRQMAMTDGRVQLAQQMKVHVTNMIKQFAETTGGGDAESLDQVNTSVSKQITDQVLSGTRAIRSVTAPNGRLFVLVGLDDKAVEELTKVAIKTSMDNDRALWQKFQAKKAQDELAEEIAKQKVVDAPMPAAH
jgi:hypothetical protein